MFKLNCVPWIPSTSHKQSQDPATKLAAAGVIGNWDLNEISLTLNQELALFSQIRHLWPDSSSEDTNCDPFLSIDTRTRIIS